MIKEKVFFKQTIEIPLRSPSLVLQMDTDLFDIFWLMSKQPCFLDPFQRTLSESPLATLFKIITLMEFFYQQTIPGRLLIVFMQQYTRHVAVPAVANCAEIHSASACCS